MAMAVMVHQYLESRVGRLESDVAHIRSDIAEMNRRQRLADSDRIWRREQTVFDIVMLLLNAVILGTLAYGIT